MLIQIKTFYMINHFFHILKISQEEVKIKYFIFKKVHCEVFKNLICKNKNKIFQNTYYAPKVIFSIYIY